ncbi:hypothetical protein GCM10027570_08780 [Streptomonospora sediminis]
MMTGTGHAPCHHGEILQGVFRDTRGRRCHGLVTLPSPNPRTRATFTPARGGRITVQPASRTKALEAAELAVAECAALTGRARCGGHLRLYSRVPIGLGMGSSTSDTIAAVRAVAASFGVGLDPAAIARLAVAAEHASDPLMLDGRPRLFAQREGRVLEDLGAALPPAAVVGCLTGNGAPVDTLSVAARQRTGACGVAFGAPGDDPCDDPFGAAPDGAVETFERLRGLLRTAVSEADIGLLGRVCSASARCNQHLLAKEELPELERLAERFGAAGVQVAHSGNVAGLLFDPAAPGSGRRIRQCTRALHRSGIPVTRVFRIRTSRTEPAHGRSHRRSDRPPRPRTAGRRIGLPAF